MREGGKCGSPPGQTERMRIGRLGGIVDVDIVKCLYVWMLMLIMMMFMIAVVVDIREML